MSLSVNNFMKKYWQFILLFVIVFSLYGNTIKNKYSLDDDFVIENNTRVQKGILGIPDLFTQRYSTAKDKVFGYRPIVLAVFAVEYQFFPGNTFVSHFINVFIYFLISIVLLKLLLRFFKGYSPFFIWAVLLLFISHPVHTEVVASLKNRDELLSFLFSILSLFYFVKYVDSKRLMFIIMALVLYVFAYLSKQSVVAFILLIPLVLYFFTDIKLLKLGMIFILLILVFVIVKKVPQFFLEHSHRVNEYFENPLFVDDGLYTRLLAVIYSAIFYLKLIIFPKYLSFYYGYNTIPFDSIFSIKAIFSIVSHLSIFIYAIIKLPKKHPISFGILFYLISISIFLNIVKPVMGIVADRYLFAAVFGFSIIVVYMVFSLFKINISDRNLQFSKITKPILLLGVILFIYSIKTINRNNEWYDRETLFNADIGHLKNSAKANELLANTYFYNATNTNVKDIKYVNNLQKSINYYKQSINIYPKNEYMLNDLAYVYMSVNKADSALLYLAKIQDTLNVNALFNKAQAYEIKKEYDKSILYYSKVIGIEPLNEKALMKLSMIYNHVGKLDNAINININFIKVNDKIETPYLNLANLYYINGDTIKAVSFAEKAIKINDKNLNTIKLVYNYYKGIGNDKKIEYYTKLMNK